MEELCPKARTGVLGRVTGKEARAGGGVAGADAGMGVWARITSTAALGLLGGTGHAVASFVGGEDEAEGSSNAGVSADTEPRSMPSPLSPGISEPASAPAAGP